MNGPRLLIRLAIPAVLAVLLAVAVAGSILCEGALRRPSVKESAGRRPGEVPAAVVGADGVRLRGVYLRPALSPASPQPRGCLVILHGIGDTHEGMEGMGRRFQADGYAVLLPDSRAHGWSGGALVTYGLTEPGDIHNWLDWLPPRDCSGRFYGLGESLGGAVLLQSLLRETRFRAVVAEGAYSSFPAIAEERVGQQSPLAHWVAPLLNRPLVFAALGYAALRHGLKLWDVSATEAVRHSRTPVLLIHGLLDRNTSIENSRRIAAANPATVRLWEVPNAGHVGAFGAAPRAFESRVLAWFHDHS